MTAHADSPHGDGPPSPATLLARLRSDPPGRALLAHVEAHMRMDPAHDLGHLLRVAAWTGWLAAPDVPLERAHAAALLHDLVNTPKQAAERASASERSAEAAHRFLVATGWATEAAADVATAIRQHSWSRGEPATTPLAIALRDADRLEALGVVGTFRCIATGTGFGSAFVDPVDPWAHDRPLDDRRFAIDHFFTKLLHLADGLVLPAARAEGARRLAVMRRLLDDLGLELGVPAPTA